MVFAKTCFYRNAAEIRLSAQYMQFFRALAWEDVSRALFVTALECKEKNSDKWWAVCDLANSRNYPSTEVLRFFFKERDLSLTRLAGTFSDGDHWLNYGPLHECEIVLSEDFGLISGCCSPQKHELQLSGVSVWFSAHFWVQSVELGA